MEDFRKRTFGDPDPVPTPEVPTTNTVIVMLRQPTVIVRYQSKGAVDDR
jgi:hypothetical protein